MKFGDDFFKKVEKKTNVNKETILGLAQKLQNGNMKDEATIREVIDTLSVMTGKKVDKELLIKEIDSLSPRDKEIMTLRYGLNNTLEYTQKEVAEMLGISQSYISRIEKKVVRKLKQVMH